MRLHDLRHNYACRRLALWREEGRDINAMLPVLTTAMGHVDSYSDCIRLLVNFACARLAIQPEALNIESFNRELIIAFLDHLENARLNGVSTRNQRLAAIKTFFHFLASSVPELMHVNETIQAIRQKNTDYTPPRPAWPSTKWMPSLPCPIQVNGSGLETKHW